jgi:hypothetical protein
MFKNLKQRGMGGFAEARYSSSSYVSENMVWAFNFSGGSSGKERLASNTEALVRAVRAF